MRRLNLRSTAFHEAGHAVSAVLNDISFSRVWILRRNDVDPPPQDVPLGQLTRNTPVNKPDVAGKLDQSRIEAVQAFTGPIIMAVGIAIPFTPLGDYLGFTALPLLYWLLLALSLLCYVILTQVVKMWLLKKEWI